MTEKKTKLKTLLKWFLIRIPLIFIVVGIMMIGALKLVERYPNPLREGFEEYLTNISGANATITHLDKITFFPNIEIFLRDLTMHNKFNAALIEMEVESVHMSAPFWSMLMSGNRINDIAITNLQANKGRITPLPIALETVRIEDKNGPEQYGSFLIVSGIYDGKKLSFEAEIEKHKAGYIIPKSVPFSLTVGRSTLNASLVKGFSSLNLRDAVFSQRGKNSPALNYVLAKYKKYNKDNPLSCLFYNGDSKECKIYLEEKDITTP